MVPVAGTHINRRPHGCPGHEESCDFYVPPGMQRRVTRSYVRPDPTKPLNLLRGGSESAATTRRNGHGSTRPRSRLATMLMRLIEAARFNVVTPDAKPRHFHEQMQALHGAAQGIELLPGVPLSDFLITDTRDLDRLFGCLDQFRGRFKGHPPHGVLLCVADGALENRILAHRRKAVPVPGGSIAVFGEEPPAQQGQERPRRPPYLAACLVGEREAGGPMEVLRAYLHPCLAEGSLFPVDSEYERNTYRTIREVTDWLLHKRGVRVTIEKPLFDIGPAEADEEEADNARVLCIPDFLLKVTNPVAGQPPVVIVETMGYEDDVYRDRKQRTHALMRAVLQGAPLLEDFPGRPDLKDGFWKLLSAILLEGIDRPVPAHRGRQGKWS